MNIFRKKRDPELDRIGALLAHLNRLKERYSKSTDPEELRLLGQERYLTAQKLGMI